MVEVLILLDSNDGPSSWAALARAAQKFGRVSAFVASSEPIEFPAPVERVYWAQDSALNAITENLAETLLPILDGFDAVLASTATLGRNLIPRLAGLRRAAVTTGVTEIVDDTHVKRLACAGNVVETVVLPEAAQKMLTLVTAAFALPDGQPAAPDVILLEVKASRHAVTVSPVKRDPTVRDMARADIVIGCGLGVGSMASVEALAGRLERLAPTAIGATRALVDTQQVSMDLLIGQTGKVIAPKVYLALGISGASQHMCGVSDAGTIIAINRDGQAPIFENADFGLVGDLADQLPALIDEFPL